MTKRYSYTPEQPVIEAAYFDGSNFKDIEELTPGKRYSYVQHRIEFEDYQIPYVLEQSWLVKATYKHSVRWNVCDDEEFRLNYTPLVLW